jgi:hypothetical protein
LFSLLLLEPLLSLEEIWVILLEDEARGEELSYASQ